MYLHISILHFLIFGLKKIKETRCFKSPYAFTA